jgi:hypothetical protein
LKAEKSTASPVVRDEILLQIQDYHDSVKKSTKYDEEEKKELVRFLRSQLNSWGLLGDDLKSEAVRKYKEKILIDTWRKFAVEMKIHPQLKPKPQKKAKKSVMKGLEQEPSTSGTIIQGDVQVLVEGTEVAVGTHEPVGQTISHKEDHAQETESIQSEQKI